MKILLLSIKRDFSRAVPLGIAYISSVLKKYGHEVRVYSPAPYEKESLEGVIESLRPDLVGISCMTPSAPRALEVAKIVKRCKGRIRVVLGGVHPTCCPKDMLTSPHVDYVVIGEGEETMLDLAKTLEGEGEVTGIKGLGYKEDGEIFLTGPRPLIADLDLIPFPDRDLFPMRWHRQRYAAIRGRWVRSTNVLSSRGCPYGCTYCASKLIFGRKVRYRTVKNTVDEVEYVLKRYGLEAVVFADDTFAVDLRRAIDICREITRRRLNLVFSVQLRVDTIHDELVKELKRAGCIQVDVGVESGSLKVLKELKKGITPEQAREAFDILARNGLRSCATFMIGSPEETAADIKETRQLARDLKADYIQFFITTPYPGTEMYQKAKREGLLRDANSWEAYHHGGTNLSPRIRCGLSDDELIRLHSKLNNEFARGIVWGFCLQPRFIRDLIIIMLCNPILLLKIFYTFLKTFDLVLCLRIIREALDCRRFPL